MSKFEDTLEKVEDPTHKLVLALLNLFIQVAKVFIIMHFVVKFW